MPGFWKVAWRAEGCGVTDTGPLVEFSPSKFPCTRESV